MVTQDLGREANQCGSAQLQVRCCSLTCRFHLLKITHCTLSGINHDPSFDTVPIGLFRQLFHCLNKPGSSRQDAELT